MAKIGRPSVYSEKVAETICQRLIEGESIRSICRDAKMPGLGTVFGWLQQNHEGFSERYARARALQAEIQANEIVEIADQATTDDWQVAKVRVDARKWVAARLVAPVYGDRSVADVNVRTPDGIQLEDVRRSFTRRIAGVASRIGANGAHRASNGSRANGA